MNGYVEDLESLLDDVDSAEFEERARRRFRGPVRTPTRQSSFAPRPPAAPASQSQVQAAAKNLDTKIDTLSNAVKTLETRTNGLAAEQERTAVALRKEMAERKKSADGIRGDLQQTKTLGVLLPFITQKQVTIQNAEGNDVKVLAPVENQLAGMLPLLLLLSPSGGADGTKGPFGDTMGVVLLASVLGR
jgi:hypothetical protein